MTYLIECKTIGAYRKVDLFTTDFESVGTITFPKNKPYDVLVETELYPTLYAKSNFFKLQNRYVIYNQEDTILASVRVGVKIIHSIIQADSYYFVKASFFKMFYELYDNRTLIGELKVVRYNHKRYFEISSTTNDFTSIIALFLLAHAVRIKSIVS